MSSTLYKVIIDMRKIKNCCVILTLINLYLLQTSCFNNKKAPPTQLECKQSAKLTKLVADASTILQRPGDTHKFTYALKEYLIMVNENFALELIEKESKKKFKSVKTKKTNLLDLKVKNKSFYAQIIWGGDINNDCQLDITLWKNPGFYIRRTNSNAKAHHSTSGEKYLIESVKGNNNYLKIRSLGQY